MLADVGVRFSAEGIDAAIQRFTSAGKAFLGLSRDADSTAVALRKAETHIGGSFAKITRHADVMHRGVAKSFGLMKSLTTGFMGGLAAQKLAGLGTGGHAADVERRADYLRIYADEKEVKAYEKHVKELRRRTPYLDKDDYLDSMFQIRSLMGSNIEANTKAAETLVNLAKILSPTGTMNQAMEYVRAMMAAYGIGKSPEEKQAMLDKIMAVTQGALRNNLVMGHDLQMAARQLAPLYANAGRSYTELIADLATAGEVAGERAGEILRNIMTKQGEGYGKVAAALRKEKLLEARGYRYEFEVPEKQKAGLSKIVKGYEELAGRHAAKLLSTGRVKEYMQELGRIYDQLQVYELKRGLDAKKTVNEAFGETANQLLPHMVKSWTSGERGKLGEILEAATGSKAAAAVAGSYKSLGAQTSIFEQRLGNLGTSFRKLYSPALAWIMERWGGSIDRVTDSLDRLGEGSDRSMQRFIDNFETGFTKAFGREDFGIEKWITGMIDNLSRGEEGWASLGADVGKVTGEMAAGLRDVAASAKEAAVSLNAIAAPFKTLSWLFGKPAELGSAHYAAQKAVSGGTIEPEANSFFNFMFGGIPYASRIQKWLGGGTGGPPTELHRATPALPQFPATAGMSLPDRLALNIMSQGLAGSQAAHPNIEVHTEPEIRVQVFVDGKELSAVVKEEMVRESMRHRRGYGDNALGVWP